MFLSRGRTIKFYRLFEEGLPGIIRGYASKGFTGRFIIYLNEYTIELELQRGMVVAALAEEKSSGRIIRGDKVIDVLLERLGERDGYVEVVELSDKKIQVDLDYAPDSCVSMPLVSQLLGAEAKPRPTGQSEPRGAAQKASSAERRRAGAGFSHEALSIAKDVAALLRIVLRADKSMEMSIDKLGKIIEVLHNSRGTYSVAYARCVTRHNRVINIVCAKTGCAAVDASGNQVEDLEEPMNCKIYLAP